MEHEFGGDLTRLILTVALVFIAISAVDCSEHVYRTIASSEILADIREGNPIEYDHVIVTGDLSLDYLGLPDDRVNRIRFFSDYLGLSDKVTPVISSIRINDSIIEGNISLRNILFLNSVNFSNTKFYYSADFSGSIFKGITNFLASEFYKSVYFSGSEFNNSSYFIESRFYGDAYFTDAQFNKLTNFIRSKFHRYSYFVRSHFKGETIFKESTFFRDVFFTKSLFYKSTDFVRTQFDGNASFNEAEFRGDLSLSESLFNHPVSFERTRFNNSASFRDSKFEGTADFGESVFDKDVNFNDAQFHGTTSFNSSRFAGEALFQDADISGTLYLIRTKYDKIYIRWDDIEEIAYDDTAYQFLINNFKNLGLYTDANYCYYQFRKEQFLHQNPIQHPFLYLFSLFAWLTYGYGKMPYFPFFWSIMLIVAFGLFWSWAGLNEEETSQKLSSWIYIIGFSAAVFLSGTRIFIEPPEIPVILGRSKSMIKKAYYLEKTLGALFFVLFFLALNGTLAV